MQRREFADAGAPPDLLRRFVPTPFRAIYRISGVPVLVQTNDIALLPAFPLEGNFVAPDEKLFEWKLVRDADVREPLEAPVALNCRQLEVVQMGPGCLLALDEEQRELLGFIGAGIDGNTYQEFLIPFMHAMTARMSAAYLHANAAHGATGL
jgi:hypothetical protein